MTLAVAACDSTRSAPTMEPDAADPDPELRILFVGNSYTEVNDLPGMLARIAATAGAPPRISVEQVTAGGARLVDHWNTGEAVRRIDERRWTHVVLQGQSVEPIYLPYFLHIERLPPNDPDVLAAFPSNAERLGKRVTEAGAQPVWYATWARAAADVDGVYASFGIDPIQMQDMLTASYARAAQQVPGSILACVGEAFRRSLAQHPGIVLHQEDGSHPTVAGTYLAASTFYVALTGNPVPAASEVPDGLSDADAALLRGVAQIGSSCGDVRALARFTQSGTSNWIAGSPMTRYVFLENRGDTAAGLSDGGMLAAPFSWASGVFPGYSDVRVFSPEIPPCPASLPPFSQCAVAVTYSGDTTANGMLRLAVSNAYATELDIPLSGTRIEEPQITFRGDRSTTQGTHWSIEGLVVAEVGQQVTFNVFVDNTGGSVASSLGPHSGPGMFPVPPFSWANGGYPGGQGTTNIEGVTYDYCTDTLAPGQTCVITGVYAPTAPPLGEHTGWYMLTYATETGTHPASAHVWGYVP